MTISLKAPTDEEIDLLYEDSENNAENIEDFKVLLKPYGIEGFTFVKVYEDFNAEIISTRSKQELKEILHSRFWEKSYISNYKVIV